MNDLVPLTLLLPTIHLHKIFEISSSKNKVRRTGFFVYFELDCLCSLQKLEISKIKWRWIGGLPIDNKLQ